MTRHKIKNSKSTYRTRASLAGADVIPPKPRESDARARREFHIDGAGYFFWTPRIARK